MRVKRFMNVILERKAPYIKPYNDITNTTIADNIYHYIQRYPIINVYFRSTALYHSKRGNVQEGKYNAYMEETTTRKKTHQISRKC